MMKRKKVKVLNFYVMISITIFKKLTAAKQICALSLRYLMTSEMTDHTVEPP